MLFAFRLCLQLGIDHPKDLVTRLGWDKFTDWMAYFRVKPFGHDVDHSMTAKLIASWSSDGVPADFMPGAVPNSVDTSNPDHVAAAFGVIPLHRRSNN